MSGFVLMVPIIVGTGPAFVTAVALAGAALGLRAIASGQCENSVQVKEECEVDVKMPNSHALSESVSEGEILPLTGNGFTVTFSKSGRGECFMRVEGKGKSKAELKKLGEELVNRVAQQYAYQRIVQEMKKKGFNVVQEKIEEDNTIKINIRKWK